MPQYIKRKLSVEILNNAMNQYYALYSYASLSQLFTLLSGNDFSSWWANLFTKANDTMGSLRAYPVSKSALGFFADSVTGRTRIGGRLWDLDTHNFDNLNPYINRIRIAHFEIPQATSFIDLYPHTQVQLYLPYLDFIELPINEIVGSDLYVDYMFDLASGTATAYITIEKDNTSYLMATKTGKIAVDLPWGKDNSVENARNIINTALSTTISVVALALTGGGSSAGEVAKVTAKVGIGTAVAKGVVSVANSLQTQFQRGGNVGSYASLLSPSSPFLIIKKHKLVDIDESHYAHIYGKPLYESKALSNLHGFTIVDNVHLEGFNNATKEEIDEVERLLKTGVHLPEQWL